MVNSEKIQNGANYCVGAASGFAAYKTLPLLAKKPLKDYLKSTICSVPKAENDVFYSSAVKAYENSFLNEPINASGLKRADIRHVDICNKKTVADEIKFRWLSLNKNDVINKKWFKLIFGDKYKMVDRHVYITSMGQNAFCVPRLKDKSSLVVVNKNKMGFSTFHELGHAMNAQGKGFKKFLSKARGPFALLVPFTLAAGLLINKPKDENSGNGKFINFVKNNCGYIAAAAMIPTLAEEGMASINGAKLAKGVLNNNMYKKLNKLNTKAWLSYLFAAGIIGVATEFAVKLRDKIVDSKPTQRIFNR
jgi:hypothetical protein